jgi:hypothetical protein
MQQPTQQPIQTRQPSRQQQLKRLKRQIYDAVNKANEGSITTLQSVVALLQNHVKIG